MKGSKCRHTIVTLMRSDKLFIVGQKWCGYTQKAVNACAHVPVVYLDEYEDAMSTIDWLHSHYTQRTVPMIFRGKELLGGSEYFD